MNEDEMAVTEPLAGDELEQVLARYARVRLDPGPAAMRRARAAVMEEAWRRHLAVETASNRGARRRGLFTGWGWRRLTGTLAAAVMAGLLVGSSVFAGSRAGGPLYGARLALDGLMLPADAGARLEAELAQAQTRLAEAVDASSRGDQGALEASLEAYGQAIAALGSETGNGAERALEAILLHRAVLASVLDGAPAAAVAGLDRAIARSDEMISRLGGTLSSGGEKGGAGQGGGKGGAQGGAGQGGAGQGGAGQGGAGHGGQPTAAPGPGSTPRAGATPRPTKDTKAAATPRPTKDTKAAATPKPRPTPDPPGQGSAERESPAP